MTNVKRRHKYDLQHLREPFLERHMFEAAKESAIYNSVPGNKHSGYHTSVQRNLKLRNAVTAPIIRQAGYISVSAINNITITTNWKTCALPTRSTFRSFTHVLTLLFHQTS